MNSSLFSLICRAFLALAGLLVHGRVDGAPFGVTAGPAYDSQLNSGYLPSFIAPNNIAPYGSGAGVGDGVAFVTAIQYVEGSGKGLRPLTWDAPGNPPVELGNLGLSQVSVTTLQATGINGKNMVIGFAQKFDGASYLGMRAVHWAPGSSSAIELGVMGMLNMGYTESFANALNDAGIVVGTSRKYKIGAPVWAGYRAVRWDASGVATELGNLGTDSSGWADCAAFSISNSGIAVGYAEKYDGPFQIKRGLRAVRWDANGTAAIELANLGDSAAAYAVNDAGDVVGSANKMESGKGKGKRAVRWSLSGSILELGHLGTDATGTTQSVAYGINANGVCIGFAQKYDNGIDKGSRAVRWTADGSVDELANLGVDANSATTTHAWSLNRAGDVVGYADEYDVSGRPLGRKAMWWPASGAAVKLDSLLAPGTGWLTLTEARGISDSNWITGIGEFDPDGTGGQGAYTRAFLLQIPEPGTAVLSCLVLSLRRQVSRRRTQTRVNNTVKVEGTSPR